MPWSGNEGTTLKIASVASEIQFQPFREKKWYVNSLLLRNCSTDDSLCWINMSSQEAGNKSSNVVCIIYFQDAPVKLIGWHRSCCFEQ